MSKQDREPRSMMPVTEETLGRSVSDFARICLLPPEADIDMFKSYVGQRMEVRRVFAMNDARGMLPALFVIARSVYKTDEIPNSSAVAKIVTWPEEQRRDIGEYLVGGIKGHEALSANTAPVEFKIDDLTMRVTLGLSQWEGLTGLFFHLKDGDDKDFVPAFVVRGNQITNGHGPEFHIRTAQPWIEETSLTIGDAKKGLNLLSPKPDFVRLIQEKQVLVNKLKRRLTERATHGTDNVEVDDFMLLVSLMFLQAKGVSVFRGIDHDKHREVIGQRSFPLNYNDLFAKWFSVDDDKTHPWVLETGKGIYIPRWDHLPTLVQNSLLNLHSAIN